MVRGSHHFLTDFLPNIKSGCILCCPGGGLRADCPGLPAVELAACGVAASLASNHSLRVKLSARVNGQVALRASVGGTPSTPPGCWTAAEMQQGRWEGGGTSDPGLATA